MQDDKVVVISQPWDAALFPNFKNEVKKARPRMVVCFAPGNTTGNEATELASTKDTLRFL